MMCSLLACIFHRTCSAIADHRIQADMHSDAMHSCACASYVQAACILDLDGDICAKHFEASLKAMIRQTSNFSKYFSQCVLTRAPMMQFLRHVIISMSVHPLLVTQFLALFLPSHVLGARLR